MLEVQNLHVSYGRILALRGVDLRVERGAAVALLGPNGAGKSTLLSAISGIVPAKDGRVVLAGEDLRGLAPHDVALRGVVQVPEGRGIFPGLSVADNLAVVASRRAHANVGTVLERFPRLAQRRSQTAGTLSGGEQQMLAVALALLADPTVLLIDELSLGLAPRVVDELFEVLHELKGEGLTILLVEQFVHRALALADRAYVLHRGQIVFSGTPGELEASGVEDAYLGGGVRGDVEMGRDGVSPAVHRPASTHLDVSVRPEVMRRLLAVADERGTTVDDILRQAVDTVVAGTPSGNGGRQNGRRSPSRTTGGTRRAQR